MYQLARTEASRPGIAPLSFAEIEIIGNNGSPFLVQRIRPVHSPFVEQANPDSMRTMKYSSRYQMTFSLMNGDPSNLNVDWDIRGAIENLALFFIVGISLPLTWPLYPQHDYAPFHLESSQIQHYASLAVKPHYREREREPSYHYLDPESLPHFINSAEWNLASAVSSYPSINFILYIPLASETPLRIHNSKGNPYAMKSFT
ncbi:hypothetical protein BC936DRAFT_140992 [Jimgerdemannia flammicorona]|uniref:Uncharacterized protein n=1 Tax=Jimgerdemannia flammicorona TaxID=994334 RepID=A0A433A328_9FUNG|nr:hypothetical protein BC936DRAFT_140992 [Jimgerdemannia flammicorona]